MFTTADTTDRLRWKPARASKRICGYTDTSQCRSHASAARRRVRWAISIDRETSAGPGNRCGGRLPHRIALAAGKAR